MTQRSYKKCERVYLFRLKNYNNTRNGSVGLSVCTLIYRYYISSKAASCGNYWRL